MSSRLQAPAQTEYRFRRVNSKELCIPSARSSVRLMTRFAQFSGGDHVVRDCGFTGKSPCSIDGIHAIALDPVAFKGAARHPRGFLPCPRAAIGHLVRWSVDAGRNPKQPGDTPDDRMTHVAQHGSETDWRVRRCRRCRAQWRRHARLGRLCAERLPGAGASSQYDRHARGCNHCTTESVDAHHCRPLHCISHESVRRWTMDIASRHERKRGSRLAVQLSTTARLRARTCVRKPAAGSGSGVFREGEDPPETRDAQHRSWTL